MFVHTALSLGFLLVSTAIIAQSSTVLTVSPGGLQEAMEIADACPTFSWGRATGATRYKVVVFDALDNDSSEYAEQMAAADPILQASIKAPALSWTPASNQCLDQGGSYLWFIQATTADSLSDWSQGRRFEIELEDRVLADAVHQEVTAQLSQAEIWKKMVKEAFKGESAVTLRLPATLMSHRRSGDTPAPAGIQDEEISGTTSVAPQASFVNPSAFRISSPDGVVFDDSTFEVSSGGNGTIPAQGQGARFMWFPAKAALRVGYVYGTEWDDANIGVLSTAVGYRTIASAYFSTALGGDTVASGEQSTAIGWGTNAIGHASTAMGESSFASGNNSTAMGVNTMASGLASTAMGESSSASGLGATALGSGTTASAYVSTAMGDSTTAESYRETVIGSWNSPSGGSPDNWVSTDPLFVIGNGEVMAAPSNAMVVLKNGNTGIGTSSPYVRLHVSHGSDCGPAGGGYLISGTTSASHICIDDNEIMARNPTTAPILVINNEGALTQVGGKLKIIDLASVGATALCQTGNIVATCSSSRRYKEAIEPLPMGLKTIEQLKPVAFKWKGRDELDLGFIAEQVASIDPLLATYNQDGEIQGVKYRQLTAVLVNAVQEQQKRFAEQEEEIVSLRRELQQYRYLAAEVAEMKRQQAVRPQLLSSNKD